MASPRGQRNNQNCVMYIVAIRHRLFNLPLSLLLLLIGEPQAGHSLRYAVAACKNGSGNYPKPTTSNPLQAQQLNEPTHPSPLLLESMHRHVTAQANSRSSSAFHIA